MELIYIRKPEYLQVLSEGPDLIPLDNSGAGIHNLLAKQGVKAIKKIAPKLVNGAKETIDNIVPFIDDVAKKAIKVGEKSLSNKQPLKGAFANTIDDTSKKLTDYAKKTLNKNLNIPNENQSIRIMNDFKDVNKIPNTFKNQLDSNLTNALGDNLPQSKPLVFTENIYHGTPEIRFSPNYAKNMLEEFEGHIGRKLSREETNLFMKNLILEDIDYFKKMGVPIGQDFNPELLEEVLLKDLQKQGWLGLDKKILQRRFSPIYGTDNINTAKSYVQGNSAYIPGRPFGQNAGVDEYWAAWENPLIYDAKNTRFNNLKFLDNNGLNRTQAEFQRLRNEKVFVRPRSEEISEWAYDKGYDGVIMKNIDDFRSSIDPLGFGNVNPNKLTTNYISFDPKKIFRDKAELKAYSKYLKEFADWKRKKGINLRGGGIKKTIIVGPLYRV